MEKKQFQAESKRLLDLMIHSIYTHKEIFLRELISNASDATDKLYYHAMQEGKTGILRDQLPITLTVDRDARTLTVSDHGCGMTAEEMESNLGTIAHSGSLQFKQENDKQEDIDIIGQFGVGFYAAFMVASKVEVVSRADGAETANRWISDGADGYTIEPCEKETVGTDITLTLMEDSENDQYSEFLDEYRLQGLVKKYSDYIRYPIQMEMTRSRQKEGCDPEKPEWEEYKELTTLNSMIPLWKKSKSELKDEDYNNFYKQKYFDFEDPLRHIHMSTEGAVTYNALLYIPSHAPMDYYTKNYEKGLALYSNGVMIMEKCADLLPDYFSFVRGLVDTADLSLNISRELLQHDRHLKLIASGLEKKIKNELANMMKNDREAYVKFFQAFGLQLKYGAYVDYGMHKELLEDLLLYHTSASEDMVSLAEYTERMPEGQKYIYYACGETKAKIELLPQMELLKEKGYEVLCLTDDIDEFCMKMMHAYKEKEFKSIADGDLDLESDEEKEEIKQLTEEYKTVLDGVKNALGDKVTGVQLTSRLKSHPCCLSAKGMVSLEMEKVLNQQPGQEKVHAERVLELNAEHPIFDKLKTADADKLAKYAQVLYAQAQLIEGLQIDDPVAYANTVCELML
ncbi:MAG: molecular chaperone HtpG [Butyricicoccus sp.]|nr:molecular chaperone HtpG [Butyricicoccus pullicaecorum]MDY5971876.1 molecular chaperone HtpG [Butyricicoccus sp.]